ncbi:MAG TPA: DUF3800 domain-containing protein [Thermoanaerobaculia bacterium]
MAVMVFLDEAGDQSLDPVDKDFPVFVLVFVICDDTEYTDVLVPAFTRLKVKHFGHDGVVLHSRDIRKAIGDFAFLQVPEKRESFLADLNALMVVARFQLIAIAIRKQSHKAKYGKACRNPYELALEYGMERLKSYLDEMGQKQVTLLAEARGKNEDDALRLAFLQLLKHGSYYHDFKSIDFELKFVSKRANVLGHQIADLCAYPIARTVIDPEKSYRAFEIVRSKFIDRPGWRHGFKTFP